MKLEDQLRRYRLSDPPPALETRLLANLREQPEDVSAPAWMRSPIWASAFAALILILTAWIATDTSTDSEKRPDVYSKQAQEAEILAALALDARHRKPLEENPQGFRPEARRNRADHELELYVS